MNAPRFVGIGLGVAAALLAGCTNFKQMVGLEPVSPDEFAVESRAPLTIPPDFNLRPPAPGAPRPQEASVASKAQRALDNAGPGEPGKQAGGSLKYQGNGVNLADPNAQIPDQSLAAKLLKSGDTNGGIVVEKRETTVLEGVY
ncbi:MAG: DUF3035 domain-containing protein [Alphaproteobacteria bacterium]|nr:DUF3035 domain-containing protein [Alphaproteobacteria bacterium]